MKNIKRLVLLASAVVLAAGCADWLSPEAIKVGHTDLTVSDKDNAYYQALREYKASEHEISFGWYSRWDDPALTTDGMLIGIPDSMDVVSLWSNSRNLSPKRMEDLRFVQKVKGTKVLICTFCQYVGKGFTPAEHDESEEAREQFWGWVDGDEAAIAASIAKYAKAISDTVSYYGYDGLDIDFEPYIDGVTGKLDENPQYATMLFSELSKYFGPKSGTGRLFVVDGEIYRLNPELATCFDYFVSQAYTVSGGTPSPTATGTESDKDSRLQQMVNLFAGQLSEEEVTNRFVITENLESAVDALNGGFFWRTKDGVTQDKNKIPSMLGMAMWQPENGFRKGGFGGYRFDNEAVNDPAYKWMRKGIQAQNPAGGEKKIFVRFNDSNSTSFEYKKNYFGQFPVEKVETGFHYLFAGIAPENTVFDIVYEPSYAAKYSSSVKYKAIDAERITISDEGKLNVEAGAVKTGTVNVSVDLKDLAVGEYVVPLKVNFPEDSPYYSDGDLVRYIKISWKDFSPIVVSVNASEPYVVTISDDDVLPYETISNNFTVTMAEAAPEALSFSLVHAPAQVENFNKANKLAFTALEDSRITLTESVGVALNGKTSDEASLSIDIEGLGAGKYLVPVKVVFPEGAPLAGAAGGELFYYVKIMIVYNNVVTDATEMTGRKIAPKDSWRANFYNGLNLSGWSGCWNNDSEAQQKALFDGNREVAAYSHYAYFGTGNIVMDLGEETEVSGIRWHSYYGSAYDSYNFKGIQSSNDRVNWDIISDETFPAQILDGNWVYLQFKTPVKARYFRTIINTLYYISIDEIEIYGPAN